MEHVFYGLNALLCILLKGIFYATFFRYFSVDSIWFMCMRVVQPSWLGIHSVHVDYFIFTRIQQIFPMHQLFIEKNFKHILNNAGWNVKENAMVCKRFFPFFSFWKWDSTQLSSPLAMIFIHFLRKILLCKLFNHVIGARIIMSCTAVVMDVGTWIIIVIRFLSKVNFSNTFPCHGCTFNRIHLTTAELFIFFLIHFFFVWIVIHTNIKRW